LRQDAAGWLREIILMDNASTDDTVAYVQAEFPGVTVCRNAENIGFGRAMNLAAAASSGEYLLMLNPDCTVQPDAVADLADFLDHRQQAGACGPMVTSPNGEFQYVSRRGFPTPLNSVAYILGLDRMFPRSTALGGYHRRHVDPRLEITTEVLSGACMMVRRSIFEAVGGFDKDYFLFGEDIDLCWKIRQAGHEIWYLPSAKAMHVKGASMRSAPRMAQREFYHSMRLFVEKRLQSTYSPTSIVLIKTGVNMAEAWARFRSRRNEHKNGNSLTP
jgi:GT2 family glycosyltransferase